MGKYQCQTPVGSHGLFLFESVFAPHPVRVRKLTLPGLDVSVQVWDKLILVVRHSSPKMRYAKVCLLGVPEVGLGNQDVAH
jgi:hypothetical protein